MKSTLKTFLILFIVALLSACTGGVKPEVKDPRKLPPNPNPTPSIATVKKPPPEVIHMATSDDSREGIEDALKEATEGRTEDAITQLKEVLNNDDHAFLAAYNLGVLYDQQDEPSKAEGFYKQSLTIEPEFTPSLLNLVRLKLRQEQSGLEIVDRYIALKPENLGHRLVKVEVLLINERFEECIEEARKIMKVDEANPRARYYMAHAHYLSGRIPLSQYIILKALEIDPQDPEINYLAGLIHLKLKDFSTSENHFAKAVQFRGDYPEALNSLGLAYYRKRNFDAAEASFSAALKFNPYFKEAHLNRGNALKALGKGDEAHAAYETILKLNPKWGDAHFAMGSLYLAVDQVTLAGFGDSADEKIKRVKVARSKIQEAEALWNKSEDKKFAQEFIAKANSKIETLNEDKNWGGGDDDGGGDGDGDGWDDESEGGEKKKDDDWGDNESDDGEEKTKGKTDDADDELKDSKEEKPPKKSAPSKDSGDDDWGDDSDDTDQKKPSPNEDPDEDDWGE